MRIRKISKPDLILLKMSSSTIGRIYADYYVIANVIGICLLQIENKNQFSSCDVMLPTLSLF
ncbi:hypothetical protein [Virgibacillus sp. L01]|uniref:hypothetical protein n=1 Tax=Virgibacillus sp. L01 TaxID=3457429 RepID=UPI003FD3CEB5